MKKFIFAFAFFLTAIVACQENEIIIDNQCPDSAATIFQEHDGILAIELENTLLGKGWEQTKDINEYLGNGYIKWVGEDYYSKPGNGLNMYQFKINSPGTYKIQIRSYIAKGSSNTEHNDVWLRLHDADDFYAIKKEHIVYPNGVGKSPNPNGASKDGWFKVYNNKKDAWSWTGKTSDHDAHHIHADFESVGVYTLEISGRSNGFAVDRIVFFQEGMENEALSAGLDQSTVSCD